MNVPGRMLPRGGRVACAAVLALALAVSPGVSGAQLGRRAQEAQSGFSLATIRALNSIVVTAMAASATPGMEVGVWVPGQGTFVHAFGTSDIGEHTPLTQSDHFRIASVTKTFTATAVLQLVDRNRLRLGAHLSSFVPGIAYGNRITIGQLLDMTAGVYDYTGDPRFERAYLKNPNLPFGAGDVLAIIRRHRPAFAPGTSVAYDNSNYYLLGLIVEKITHQPLGRAIDEQILRPLGMRQTSYPTGSSLPKPFARGYYPLQSGGLRDVTISNPAVAAGSGAMISTLNDVKAWAQALAAGSLLKPATQARRLATRVVGQTEKVTVRYGMGIININGFLGHNGAILGYGSAMFYLPSRRATIIVLGNNNNFDSEIPTNVFLGIASYLFPQQFPRGI
jgi:D-alanyl-D-alanine carboxypeptidase